jgi:hypothetical protein
MVDPTAESKASKPKAEAKARSPTVPKAGEPAPAPAKAPPKSAVSKGAPPAKVAPIETGGPVIEPAKPTPGVTPKGVVTGAAGVLAAVSVLNDVIKDMKAGNFNEASAKAALLYLSSIPEAQPLLFAAGVIMNYWGPRHDKILKEAFKFGEQGEELARAIPLLGRSETVRRVFGAIIAARVAVDISIAYTVEDMAAAIAEGGKTLLDFSAKAVLSDPDGVLDDQVEALTDKIFAPIDIKYLGLKP